MMNKSLVVALLWILFTIVHAYRDGAREESCYNHSIVHERAFINDCGAECRFFLIVKEVANEATLELGNETTSYECGKIYGIEVANDLNAPEGYLVQARDGTEDSSEIIGTFLDPNTVQERNPTVPLNFKILQCGRSMNSTGELLDNSATHPDTVNMAGILQLYWQAPNCTSEYLPNVTLWFTIVQQLTVVYNPSKSTVLTYVPPPPPDVVTPTPTPSMMESTMALSTVAVLPTSTQAVNTMPAMTPFTTDEKVTDRSTTSIVKEENVTPFPVVILAAGVGAGGVALIILVIVCVVSVIIYVKSSTIDHNRNHSKKSKQSRVSALWVASTTEPEPADSNGKQNDYADDTDHKLLTIKNGNDVLIDK